MPGRESEGSVSKTSSFHSEAANVSRFGPDVRELPDFMGGRQRAATSPKPRPLATVTAVVYDVSMRLLASILLLTLPVLAQDKAPDKQDDKAKKAPAGPPTNLKVLKVTSRAEVGQIMRTFTAGLGVQCNFCHVADRASDDNPKKEVARHMIEMVEKINAGFPDGKMHVTCYTCHRGETEPKTAPEPKPAQ
jgi:hypothetical protein